MALLPMAPASHEDAPVDVAAGPSGFSGADKPEYSVYSHCVHCGLCLNHCPTYRLWGQEADSPRGRIRQMELVDQGKLELGDSFVEHIDRCLDCRACETACPSGVEYGRLIETARAQIEQHYKRPLASRLARDFVYRRLLPYPSRIATAARFLKFYQRSGLAALARATGALRLLGLQDRERLLPRIDSEFFFTELGKTFPAHGTRRARVALFAGCVAQVTFSELNRATIRVLQANGCEVVVPEGQVCCGALPNHAGVRDVARDLARKNFGVFPVDEFDAIVTNAAGCGSTLKEYAHLFAPEDPAYAQAAKFTTKDARRYRVSRGTRTHCAAAARAAARYLSGFLPSGSWTEDSRSPAQADSRRSRGGISGDAAGRSMLRFGRRLQRDGDRGVPRIARQEDGLREADPGAEPSSPRIPAASCSSALAPASTQRIRKFSTSLSFWTARSLRPSSISHRRGSGSRSRPSVRSGRRPREHRSARLCGRSAIGHSS